MWLYFDSTGSLKEILEHGSPARTGSTNFEIFAFFEDLDILTDYGSATLKLLKPVSAYDETASAYYPISMTIKTITFEQLDSELNLEYFSNNTSYTGYYFNFNVEDDDEALILLDTPGIWHAIISLFGLDGTISVQGDAEFNVQDTGYSETETTLPDGYTIDSIYQDLARKLNIKSNGYIKVVSTIDMTFDTDIYNEGDVLFAKAENAFYRLVTSDGELTYELIYDLDCIQFVTQEEYDALVDAGTVEEDIYYFITDDTTYDDILEAIATIKDTTIAGLDLNSDISSQDLTDNLVLATNDEIDELFDE